VSSIYGKNIKVTIFGQSHSKAIGVSIEGLPAGIKIDMEELEAFMQRRAPGQGPFTTQRKESDRPEILSGLVDNVTCGAPVAAIIRNKDTRPGDYDQIRDVPRPSHADYTANIKFGGFHDYSGGGHFSGRLTAPLCIAGGLCLQLLRQKNIHIGAHIASIGNVSDTSFDPAGAEPADIELPKSKPFPVIDDARGEQMLAAINEARLAGDSLGGVIECAVVGVPAGIGDPIFDGMENCIALAVFGIPAVKGIEFGSGFAGSSLRGSANNDPFIVEENRIKTKTNNHGGILGGITTGMPVIFRVAIKPTPSIGVEQDSISYLSMENVKLSIKGRHDPCIVPRAIPCVEAAAAIAVLDRLLESSKY
jgi:chorismate synthase